MLDDVRAYARLFLEKKSVNNVNDSLQQFAEYIQEIDPDLTDEITTKDILKILEEEKMKLSLIEKAKKDDRIRISQQKNKKNIRRQVPFKEKDMPSKENLEKLPERNSDNNTGYDIEKTSLFSTENETNLNNAINNNYQEPFRNKIINIFDYLLSVYSMMREVVRNVTKYEDLIYYDELPGQDDDTKDVKVDKQTFVIEKQDIPPAPAPPPLIDSWIIGDWRNPLANLSVKESITVSISRFDDESHELLFSQDKQRENAWQYWFNQVWKPWADKNASKAIVQELYRKLFLLSQRLERQLEELELVWGHGMLYWQTGNEDIKHPIITTKAALSFDEKSGKVLISSPEMSEPKLEMEFIYSIKNAGMKDLAMLSDDFKLNPINPWNEKAFESFCKRFVNLISPEGRVKFDSKNQKTELSPLITYEPVLIVRKKRIGYRQDLEEVINGLRRGETIPQPIDSIIKSEPFEKNSSYNVASDEIRFPLFANDEQLEIVNRLAKHVGVTVQGPPGTGKSHTIANLVSHMLSKGRKVLVIAKAERPLRVLRGMIPENIRPFCVTLFSDESSSLNELEQAVKAISEISSTLDNHNAEMELESLERNIKEIREEIAETRNIIKKVSQQEYSKYSILGKELTLSELGLWLSENETEYGWISDDISHDEVFPMSQKELYRYFELSGIIKHDDKTTIEYKLPDINYLPSGKIIKEKFEKLNYLEEQLKNSVTTAEGQLDLLKEIDLKTIKEMLLRSSKVYNETEKVLQEKWLCIILEDTKHNGSRKEFWDNLIRWCKEKLQLLYKLNEKTSANEITIPGDCHKNELLDIVNKLETYFQNRRKIGLWSKIVNSKFRYVLANCYIDGLNIRNHKDVQLVQAEIEKRLLKEKMFKRWENDVVSIGGPDFAIEDVRLAAKIDDSVLLIQSALELKENVWDPLIEDISAMGFSVPITISLEELKVFIDKLEVVNKKLEANKIKTEIKKLRDYLKEHQKNSETGKSLWAEFSNSLDQQKWMQWDNLLKEVARLNELQVQVSELKDLHIKLSQVAPHWASQVVASGGQGNPLTPPQNYQEAWEWAKAETWLKKLMSQDPIALSKKLDSLKDLEKKLVADIVAMSTKINLSKQVTEDQRRSLMAWQQIIRKIGKGKGKYASRYRREAQEEMKKARSAVPVWIMPLNKVIDSFPAWSEPFDLVIIDESSQLDIFGVLAFFRAKKVLVVGDDKQISPQGVGIERSSIHKLIDNYLKDIPHGNLFEPHYSLYDLSKQIFPGVIMLKEHFRCLPEIIQFSNDNMYQGDILPLRQKDSRLPENWEPIIHMKLENGFRAPGTKINEPEAEDLIEAVINCCKNDDYEGMTMGIISLLGSEQGQLIEQMLFEALTPEEIKQRKILCGDAYYFQGDERDVIFMSMVDAKGDNRLAVLNKPDDWKRFNVAVSRAKNQTWLFHSLNFEDLNKNDVRYHLIRYFQNPHRLQQEFSSLEDLCDSDFEKRVLKDLLSLGYTVKPQFKVGHKRIDLVVLGMRNNKLAVECDGDSYHGIEQWEDDWNRQIQLERLGWKFFRIRGSAYYRNPEKTIKDLVRTLEDMEIYPYNKS